MNRVLPTVFVLALGAPAFGQTVDGEGAKQLSEDLSRYVGKQAIDKGILAVSVEGDAYKISFDLRALAAKLPKQDLPKFDFPLYTLLVKPLSDGSWNVFSDFSTSASFEMNGPDGQQSTQFVIKDGKFTGVYDPELAAFANGSSSLSGMTMTSRSAKQETDLSVGSSTSKLAATRSANGGVDFTVTQASAGFVETIKINDPAIGMKVAGAFKASDLAVDVSAKAMRTKPLLDLLAFGVAHEDEAQLRADQGELKALLLAALPLWERIDGTYILKNFALETYGGNFGAAQLSTSFGADGVAQNGKLDYAIKASGLTLPQTLPGWTATLLPTDIDLNFGGANIDLDSMARKAIEAFDLNQNPPLPVGFGDTLTADFMAKAPKAVIGHSTMKNSDIEVAMEGEMTFPGMKPEANVTIDIAGYDKIVESLQTAAKSEPEAAQYFPVVLAVKGFGKTLPDGRMEWVINAKADGSITVNGAMLKPADAVQGGPLTDPSDATAGDNGGAGTKLQP
ncbi:hypothetical protein GCM10010869_43870 [Mesorhizobium tianshanense]|uniref:DUF2125 domain-containing protein n=1 Tax=Mesorhizobium tianshanense TaxID=39844 RepID=A0A562PF26_9HYPH|nr:hypothetical protein [Mesorhizobium tianshanense]TWI42596.1 hypothetical protein IQ26_00357 [Mesorhizobium tianshanense]GLS38790.1 hypothetical protein GCM10010869_43870 [Mesorhizobium tianshanense]